MQACWAHMNESTFYHVVAHIAPVYVFFSSSLKKHVLNFFHIISKNDCWVKTAGKVKNIKVSRIID